VYPTTGHAMPVGLPNPSPARTMPRNPAPGRRLTRVGILLLPLLLAFEACQDTPLAPRAAPPDPLMATTSSSTGCLIATASDSTLLVGDSARLSTTVLLRKRNGRPVTEAPIWSSSDPSTVSISGSFARALRAGTVILVAAVSSCSATIPVSVSDKPATGIDTTTTTSPPTPSATKQLALSLTVFDATQPSPLSSNGIPLPKGWLFEKDLASTILSDGTAEVPRVLRPLAGRHGDGSLRAVLLQFQANPATPRMVLQVGITPRLSEPAPWPIPAGTPSAVTLPADPAFLLSTQIAGPTIPVSESPLPQYESQFTTYAEKHFQTDGVQWEYANYYDRALNHFVYWMRSGNVTYWKRALDLVRNYRTGYLEANNYDSVPHWLLVEGLALHYWFTGDTLSRTAVLRSAARATIAYNPIMLGDPNGLYIEGRIEARMLLASLFAWELGDTSQDWKAKAATYAKNIMTLQRTDGSYSWPNWCGRQGNYMVGLQNDALIKYFERVTADPAIIPTIQKAVDYIYRTSWRPANRAFAYMDAQCGSPDDLLPSPDLNMLLVNGFAFIGKQTGNRQYIAVADSIAEGAIAGAWLSGSKQFNQQYYDSHQYLWYRR
jgi:hypothetical protein